MSRATHPSREKRFHSDRLVFRDKCCIGLFGALPIRDAKSALEVRWQT
jgi:hypothetical protein